MTKDYNKIVELIENINDKIYNILEGDYYIFYLIFTTDGYCWNIQCGENNLFSSENDYIEYNTEDEFYIKLNNFLIDKIRNHIIRLTELEKIN